MSLLTQRGIASDASPEELRWRAVDKGMWVDVLEFLGAHTRANYDRINIWTATYRVHVEQYLSPAHVKGAFGDRVPPEISSGLIQELELNLKVVIDNRSDSIFRETDTIAFRFLVPESRRPVDIPDTGPVDQRSIVTPEHYVHFIPENPPTLAAPSNHPAAQNKRAARRVPPEEGHGRHHAELLDPRLFFRCSTPSAFWEELDMYVAAIKGADCDSPGLSDIGEGSMTITESRPHEFVKMRLEFVKPMEDTSITEFTFQPEGDRTRVTWTMYGENGFVSKAFCMFMDMDKMVGGQFEEGLQSMKNVVEEVEEEAAVREQTEPAVESGPTASCSEP